MMETKQTQAQGSRKFFKILLPLLILLVGGVTALVIVKTAPEPRKATPPRKNPQVQVQEIQLNREKIQVSAMGTVIPARRLELKSRVGGEIVEVHPDFIEGGFIPKGSQILRIDPSDYRLAVTQNESKVVEAGYQFKLELGRQDVAEKEWQLLNDDRPASELDLELALRKPHLAKARADLAAMQAALQQARLDLERTRITAPFDVMVLTKNVEKGSQVTIQEVLAELVGTDEYWIQASIPADRLSWFVIPRSNGDEGAEASIQSGQESQRSGRVIKLLADLEEEGRMARILIAVRDPLGIESREKIFTPLLIGQFVRVLIDGKVVENAARVPRTVIQDNSRVWVVDVDGKLEGRRVKMVWREKESVLIQGNLHAGDRLLLSEVVAPYEGMPVDVVPGPSATQTSEKNSREGGHGG